jgi:hypothetical protein
VLVGHPAVADAGRSGAGSGGGLHGGGVPWMRSWREMRSAPRRCMPPAMTQGIERMFDLNE